MSDAAKKQAQELYQTGKIPWDAARAAAEDPFRVEVLTQLTNMASSMKEIQVCLTGNNLGTTGLVKRVDDLEKNDREAGTKRAFHGGAIAVISAGCSALAAWWAGHK